MTLKEWNDLIKYANLLCCELNELGGNVNFKCYGHDLGKRGIVLQTFDILGNLYNEYHSGIDTYAREKYALAAYANKIKEEL